MRALIRVLAAVACLLAFSVVDIQAEAAATCSAPGDVSSTTAAATVAEAAAASTKGRAFLILDALSQRVAVEGKASTRTGFSYVKCLATAFASAPANAGAAGAANLTAWVNTR